MKKVYIFAIALVVFGSLPASATIINIPDNYPSIQQGIDASSDGDTVLVQPGTYVENINYNGHNVVLGSLFLTTGDTTYIGQTIIDGDSSGSVVTFESEEDSTAIIAGFVVQNGLSASIGGGISCVYSDPTITNNHIRGNSAIGSQMTDGTGGGIYCSHSDATISHNTISGNVATGYPTWTYGIGGGIYCYNSSAKISNNLIFENDALGEWGFGGGIGTEDSNPIIKNNLLIGNSSSGDGGGINCSGLNEIPFIENNIIMDNSADSSNGVGGGIHCIGTNAAIDRCLIKSNTANYGAGFAGGFFGGSFRNCVIVNNSTTGSGWNISGAGIFAQHSDFSIANCTISENISEDAGAGLHCGNAYAAIVNSIFWNNMPSEISAFGGSSVQISFSDIMGGWQGDGNFSTDPLFRDPENGDFHLMSTECGDTLDSPCIDAGDPNILDSLLDCSWGLGTILSDMGAYGGGDSVTVGIDYLDIPFPEGFSISQNYPNPFNSATTIRYSLAEAGEVTVEIFDLLGRRIQSLTERIQSAGSHSVVWDAAYALSGVYFYRISAGDYKQTRKCVLLR